MNNHDEVPGDYKRSRIAEMMKHRFLGGGPVEPPDVHYSERIIMGEKARGVSTYEMGRGSELMEYGLTWVGWLEKYSSYAKREGGGEGTPIFQQTIVEELMRADADARAQKTWFEDEPGESAHDKKLAEVKQRARRARERQMYILRDDDDED